VCGDDGAQTAAPARDFLDTDRVRVVVETCSAPLLGERHAHQTELRHLVDEVARELVFFVYLGCARNDFLVHELRDHVTYLLLLRRE